MNLKKKLLFLYRYARKCVKEASVDRCVLRDWEETVNKFIDEKIDA